MRIREPLPTAPVARWMTTPAARAFNKSCTSLMGALCVTSAALMVETALPSLPISVGAGIPVTMTCDSSSIFCSSATRTFVSPTSTVSATARKPMRRTWSTTLVPERSSKRNRPLASVNARSAVPATVTCTSPTGAPEPRLTTTPATDPPCALTDAGARTPNVRARLHRTEEHRMPRPPREKRLPILPARGSAARARALRLVPTLWAFGWRVAERHDMFPNSIRRRSTYARPFPRARSPPFAGRARGPAHPEARPARAPLGRDHRQAARRHRRRHDFPEGRQPRRRRVRHARRRHDHVGRALLGRRNPGAHLQPADQEGHRDQRPRRRAHRRHAGLLPLERDALPARVRAARRHHPRHAGRPHDDARRVRETEPARGARAGDPNGRWVRDRGGDSQLDRAEQGLAQAMALLARCDAAARG